MKIKTLNVLVLFLPLFVTVLQAQKYRIQNKIGIYGGITQYDIDTNSFTTKSENGWLMGLTTVVNIPHKWYNLSYKIQFSENEIGIFGTPATSQEPEFIDYKLFVAQAALIGHIKVFKNHFSIDVGPMIQYNGNLDLKKRSQEAYIIDGYNTITAKGISEISGFNANATLGVSLGFNMFKIKAAYIYSATNILNKLNKQNFSENTNFKGNQSMLVFAAMVVL